MPIGIGKTVTVAYSPEPLKSVYIRAICAEAGGLSGTVRSNAHDVIRNYKRQISGNGIDWKTMSKILDSAFERGLEAELKSQLGKEFTVKTGTKSKTRS